jgi:hypothetical protein
MTTTTRNMPEPPAGAEPVSSCRATGGRAALAAAVGGFYRRLPADRVPGPFVPGGVS